MPVENPSFDSVNTAIEQAALSDKMSSLKTKRQARDEWAVRDGVSKGLHPAEVPIIRSRYDNSPSANQLRRADELDIDSGDGYIYEDYSGAVRSRLVESATEPTGDEPIPEITPALTGLRKVVSDMRLRRAENKLENTVSRKAVAAHAGTIVLRNKFGEGYYTHASAGGILQAPKPERDKKQIDKMERLETKKHKNISRTRQLEGLVTDSHDVRRIKSREKKSAKLTRKVAKIDRKIHRKAYETPRISKKIEKRALKVAKLRARNEAITEVHAENKRLRSEKKATRMRERAERLEQNRRGVV